MLPTFLIVGAMKSGTDSLWEYVRSHPEVYMPDSKEPDFFIEEGTWWRGLTWYEAMFEKADGAAARGEASTGYAKFPLYKGVPGRIARTLPDVKLIYLMRHPVERMRSHYLHAVINNEERRPIAEALRRDDRYMWVSSYAMQLERYLEHFDRGQLLPIMSEDLRRDRRATLRRVLTFIGVEPDLTEPEVEKEFHRTEEKRSLRPLFASAQRLPGYGFASRLIPRVIKEHTLAVRTHGIRPDQGVMPTELRRELEDRLREDVGRLRGLLGPGFDGWGIA